MRVHLGFGGSPLFGTFPEDIVHLVLLLNVDVAQILDDHGTFLVGIVVQPTIFLTCYQILFTLDVKLTILIIDQIPFCGSVGLDSVDFNAHFRIAGKWKL